MSHPEKPPAPRGQSLFSVFRSVASSMFGVQSSKQHQEDFTQGKVSTYIIVGIVATILFFVKILGVVLLVVYIVERC